MLTISEAMAKRLLAHGEPVVDEYTLFLLMRALYRTPTMDGEPILVRRSTPPLAGFKTLVKRLVDQGALAPDGDFGHGVYTVSKVPPKPADEICCLVDPFCYISHLSAMQRHGLSDRQPAELHLTSPHPTLWSAMREDRMRADYGDDYGRAREAVPLQRVRFAETVRRRPVRRHTARHPGFWRRIRASAARVATVGQTFLDTLESPEWCGGMGHVIEVWEEHAGTFVEEIVAAVDRAPTKLAKVRAGYLLQERLGLARGDGRVEGWKRFAQRGGSQKLDPEAAYAPVFSEAWMLSLNV